MIKTLSPYYITTDLSSYTHDPLTVFDFKLYLRVWAGDKSTPITTDTYVVNKTVFQNEITINVSNILNSLLSFAPKKGTSTSLLDGNNQLWLRHFVVHTYEADVNDTTVLLTKGYGYGNEGMNPQPPTNKVMITQNEFNVNRKGVFCLPILLDTI